MGQKTTSRGISYNCKACSGSGSVACPPDCSSCGGSGTITEDLQRETREKYRPKFVDLGPSRALTIPLIVINLGVYLVLEARPELAIYVLTFDAGLAAGHYWTLLTSSFVHFATSHILLNMLFLWAYGPLVEGILGKLRYLGLYLFSALTAGGVSYLGNILLEQNSYAGVGASGPLFGLMGYLFTVWTRWKLAEAVEGERLAKLGGAILVIGFGLSLTGFDLIDNWGHLGGALGGVIFGYLSPKPKG